MANLESMIVIAVLFAVVSINQVATENDIATPETLAIPATETQLQHRREFVRNMTLDAWNAYRTYAWGDYAVKPLEKKPFEKWTGTGGTIVSAMSALHVMGLQEQFNQGKQWIEKELDFSKIDQDVHVFLTIVHHIGGLLSVYAQTGEEMFKEKAIEIEKAIRGAFNTTTGVPPMLFNPKNQTFNNDHNVFLTSTCLQEPELIFISDITNNSAVKENLLKVRTFMKNIEKPKGLYLQVLNVKSGKWDSSVTTLRDVQYELYFNLVRSYIQSGGRHVEDLEMYAETMKKILENSMFQTSEKGYVYTPDYWPNVNDRAQTMQDSSCNLGAMLALGAAELAKRNSSISLGVQDQSFLHSQLAQNLTKSCTTVLNKTKTKLLPQYLSFGKKNDATVMPVRSHRRSYSNSELAETYFILWRLTHNERYRENAWQLAQAIQKHQRTESGGYSTIEDVNTIPTSFKPDSFQYPHVISSTFNFLYLTFSDDTVLPLNEWIFGAAGHPLPICGKNKVYPVEKCQS